MSLVVAIKCTDGLVLAADSRGTNYRFDPEISESNRTVLDDKTRKLHSFRAPFDNVGVLSFDYAAISAGFSGGEEEIAAQTQRHSIDVCIRRFKEQLYKTHPKKQITVHEFRERLYKFLIEYWQYYRETRRTSLDKMNQYSQENAPKQSEFVPPSMFEVKLLVAGFNKHEQEGHVFPIWLTDDDKEWEGLQYRGTLGSVEIIPDRCGIFCDGMTGFLMPVLRADEPIEIIENFQCSSTEAIVAELVAIKARFDIKYVIKPPQPGFFSCDDITAHDAQRLAQLLIRGTIVFFGEKEGVGGAIRICTINPLTGTKCRKRF